MGGQQQTGGSSGRQDHAGRHLVLNARRHRPGDDEHPLRLPGLPEPKHPRTNAVPTGRPLNRAKLDELIKQPVHSGLRQPAGAHQLRQSGLPTTRVQSLELRERTLEHTTPTRRPSHLPAAPIITPQPAMPEQPLRTPHHRAAHTCRSGPPHRKVVNVTDSYAHN